LRVAEHMSVAFAMAMVAAFAVSMFRRFLYLCGTGWWLAMR
jgi:hypothetical protein